MDGCGHSPSPEDASLKNNKACYTRRRRKDSGRSGVTAVLLRVCQRRAAQRRQAAVHLSHSAGAVVGSYVPVDRPVCHWLPSVKVEPPSRRFVVQPPFVLCFRVVGTKEALDLCVACLIAEVKPHKRLTGSIASCARVDAAASGLVVHIAIDSVVAECGPSGAQVLVQSAENSSAVSVDRCCPSYCIRTR